MLPYATENQLKKLKLENENLKLKIKLLEEKNKTLLQIPSEENKINLTYTYEEASNALILNKPLERNSIYFITLEIMSNVNQSCTIISTSADESNENDNYSMLFYYEDFDETDINTILSISSDLSSVSFIDSSNMNRYKPITETYPGDSTKITFYKIG